MSASTNAAFGDPPVHLLHTGSTCTCYTVWGISDPGLIPPCPVHGKTTYVIGDPPSSNKTWGWAPTTPEVCPQCGHRFWTYGDPPGTSLTFKVTITISVPAMRADEV